MSEIFLDESCQTYNLESIVNEPLMNKDIHKAIMTRTRLRYRFLKKPTR